MKTNKYIKALVNTGFILVAGIMTVCAQTTTNKTTLSEFNSIVISAPADVMLVQGTENSISIKEGDLQDLVSTEIKDNVLFIKKAKEDITINFVKLEKLELISPCEVKCETPITSDNFDVRLKGAASEADLNVNVKNLTTSIEGAGDIEYTGTAETHNLTVSGAGDVSAYDLKTNSTEVVINGAGDAKVNAKQELKGTINGAGEITYMEEPVTKDIKINGVGSYGLNNGVSNSDNGDTTKVRFGHKKLLIVGDENKHDSIKKANHKDKFKIYWSGVGIGVNGYLNANNKTTIPAGYDFLDLDYRKSINISLNLLEKNFPIWKNHINLVTGLGFDFSNYRFSENYILTPKADFITAVYDSAIVYKKNKLQTSYLNVPLLFQFDTNPYGKHNRTIHLSAGIVGGVKIGSHTKQLYEIDGVKYNPKTKDDFNLNPFRYSAMVRVGVGKLDLYASYAMNGLFKKDEGPQLYPFTIGINIAGL